MRYAYSAIFTPEDGGVYSVHFPDLPGCVTCGDDVPDAVIMAQDALCLWLYDLEQDNRLIPKASNPKDMQAGAGGFTSVVAVDTNVYRRFYEKLDAAKQAI